MPRPRQLSLFREYAQTLTVEDRTTVTKAMAILDRTLRKQGVSLDSPDAVAQYLKLHFAGGQHEVFTVLFLDSHNRLLEATDLFRGTVSQTSVYPREVVKMGLSLNASAVILSHNHPSQLCEPSRADEFLTQNLKSALALVDIKILDHIVVGGTNHVSFAQRGLLEPRPAYG